LLRRMAWLSAIDHSISSILRHGLLLGLLLCLLLSRMLLLLQMLLLHLLLLAEVLLLLQASEQLLRPHEIRVCRWHALLFHLVEFLRVQS